MNWQEGQRVECEGLNWGVCYLTLMNEQMAVVYCPQYEIVTTGSPEQLKQVGWRPIATTKVIYLDEWVKSHHHHQRPVPTS
ncbi:hypothetical protein [Thermocoleostomius sinensis]|uniref:Uncharacterized protein n=1 Tax=Thermocoleostomius sinensis A174 TaxID=2016057 RepID=A0A9E8ZC43_9CYAN|nr:hypothetical protein [Thermocoleostomius sinensis]WAL60127.1 hypothetical protein OXH18_23645 [Thermocoleostomius sinensis A174]